MKPSSNAIMFMGDCVRATGNPIIERLSCLENVAEVLVWKLGDSVNAWVLEASRFQGPFAVYEAFVPSLSSRGEPLSYDPEGFPASQAITSLLNYCIAQVNEELCIKQEGRKDPESCVQETKEFQVNCMENYEAPVSTGSVPNTLILGFSKGGVVLNQLLAELAHAERSSEELQSHGQSESNAGALFSHKHGVSCNGNNMWPTAFDDFLKSIAEIHFVDVGLNCPGAYQTDPCVLENVVKAAKSSSSGLHLAFHGTPRQWNDRTRPWISSEKDCCIQNLQKTAKRLGLGSDKIRVTEKIYFQKDRPSLQMHFQILDSLDLD